MTDPIKLAIEALESCTHVVVGNVYSGQIFDDKKVDLAIAALRSIKPDCKACADFSNANGPTCLYPTNACTNGDKFQALAPVYLYRRT